MVIYHREVRDELLELLRGKDQKLFKVSKPLPGATYDGS